MDPPYWQTEGYGEPFEWAQYESIDQLMREIKGKSILSINDHPDIRPCCEGLQMEVVPITHLVGGGAKRVERNELIIYSCDRAGEPAGLF